MALWDHVGDDEASSVWSRGRATKSAQSKSPLPQFLRREVNLPRSGNDNDRTFFANDPASELDCLRHVLAPELLRAAERRSRELDIGAEQVLIRWGMIDEAAYLRRLSLYLGVANEDFSHAERTDMPLTDLQMRLAAEIGLMPLRLDGRLIWTMAPRRLATRALCQFAQRYPWLRPSWRLTSTNSLQQFITQQGGAAMARGATRGLGDLRPDMTAAPADDEGRLWWHRMRRAAGVSSVLLLPAFLAGTAWSSMLAVWFLAFMGLRLVAGFWPRQPLPEQPRLPDNRLPMYTIISALYREASSVAPLMQAINALDYPREKLDVIFVTELDDLQTRAAIARLGPMPHLQVLVAPAAEPKTKPKALNWALPFARGSFIAVLDAEDRPVPNQLRAALDAFRARGPDVACAQASLCIDNEIA